MINLVIDIDDVVPEGKTSLIISHPTGIEYDIQAGGMACMHPRCEGFVIDMGKFMQDFDDCKDICAYMGLAEEEHAEDQYMMQTAVAEALDKAFKENTTTIRFDYDRLNELMEGWWPVTVNGGLQSIMSNDKDTNLWRGYIHTKNCD